MIQDFVESYAKLIVTNPELVNVEVKKVDDTFSEVTIFAHRDDVGKLIGKNGNMINALKTMLNGCKAKDSVSYKIQVASVN